MQCKTFEDSFLFHPRPQKIEDDFLEILIQSRFHFQRTKRVRLGTHHRILGIKIAGSQKRREISLALNFISYCPPPLTSNCARFLWHKRVNFNQKSGEFCEKKTPNMQIYQTANGSNWQGQMLLSSSQISTSAGFLEFARPNADEWLYVGNTLIRFLPLFLKYFTLFVFISNVWNSIDDTCMLKSRLMYALFTDIESMR